MTTNRRIAYPLAALAAGYLVTRTLRRTIASYSFRDKVVVIPGGSRGLGLIMARQLADEGARLVILARDQQEIGRAVEDLSAHTANVLGIACDIRDQGGIRNVIEQTIGRFGQVDVLINDAGIIMVGPFEHVTDADFKEAMDIHFWGPLNMIRAVLPLMRARGGGRIVNIVSIGGKIGVPHLASYCASKFALAGLSETLRAELVRENIYLTSVYPAPMRTGSHVNALFKGRHDREFTWFALSDALPGTSMSAERAARKILTACRLGDPQLIIPVQARLATAFHGLAPNLTSRLMQFINRLMPPPSLAQGTESRSGWTSQSRWAPSRLTRLADRETERNNELAGHSPPA